MSIGHGSSSSLLVVGALCLAIRIVAGCASAPSTSPYGGNGGGARNTVEAERLTHEALSAIDRGKLDDGERLLRQALAADLFHGPAHNNLGVLLLNEKNLYEAAGEFEWARKLMPGHPDPRYNLGLTLERAGRTDDALAMYDTALEVYSESVPAMQAIARLSLRRKRDDARIDGFLEVIAIRGETPQWRSWAQTQMAMRTK